MQGGTQKKNDKITQTKKEDVKKTTNKKNRKGGKEQRWEYYKTYETNYPHYDTITHNTHNSPTTYTQSQPRQTPKYTTKQCKT